MLINFEVLRTKKQMSKKEFAEFIGVTPPTYRSWLSGKPIPSSKLIELSDKFKCTVDYLLDHDPLDTGQRAS